jgi:hypothetical protein
MNDVDAVPHIGLIMKPSRKAPARLTTQQSCGHSIPSRG